jgi:hypothetical protein
MAVESLRRSDVSGAVIPEGTGARVRVVQNDRDQPDLRADLTDAEVKKLLPWAKPVVTRPTRRSS